MIETILTLGGDPNIEDENGFSLIQNACKDYWDFPSGLVTTLVDEYHVDPDQIHPKEGSLIAIAKAHNNDGYALLTLLCLMKNRDLSKKLEMHVRLWERYFLD